MKNSFRNRSRYFGAYYCLGEPSFRVRKVCLEILCVRSEVHRGFFFFVFVSIILLSGNLKTCEEMLIYSVYK